MSVSNPKIAHVDSLLDLGGPDVKVRFFLYIYMYFHLLPPKSHLLRRGQKMDGKATTPQFPHSERKFSPSPAASAIAPCTIAPSAVRPVRWKKTATVGIGSWLLSLVWACSGLGLEGGGWGRSAELVGWLSVHVHPPFWACSTQAPGSFDISPCSLGVDR